jgi:hypothetical protein
LKASGSTSARKDAHPRPSSDRSRPSREPRSSPTKAESFGLPGPSSHPDPKFHAFRNDLADIALTGQVIASHYASPVERRVASPGALRESGSDEGLVIRQLEVGEPFLLLDDSLGWAWGYAGEERRVGYVRSECLGR